MSPFSNTVKLFKVQVMRDGVLLNKIRSKETRPDAYSKEDAMRINDFSKYFLAWYFGVTYGMLGFRSGGAALWGLTLMTMVSNVFIVNYLGIRLETHGEPMEFVLSGMASSFTLFLLTWVFIGTMSGRLN